MDDTFKYLIHADVAANGVVERSDVVGAIFGQTEGLLGEELDLRDLQQSSKVGRIDVEVSSEAGQSFGDVTIASSLDRVDTAILAASLETITRVGPCRARVDVTDIEDVRQAKRREVVERAKELLGEAFDESITTSEEIQAEVREAVRVADVTEYDGLPAGPRVGDADAVILVEGRADVVTLLKYGIKNAVAVEGTDVPDAVAGLTQDRTVTAFLDGDRGGELILRELRQVGDVDYVAFAPDGRSVEDLPRHEVVRALQEKVEAADLPDDERVRDAVAGDATAGTDGGTVTVEAGTEPEGDQRDATAASGPDAGADPTPEQEGADPDTVPEPAEPEPDSLAAHARAVVGGETDSVRLLDADLAILDEAPADGAAAAVGDADEPPHAVVLDGSLTQRLLDVLAEHGVEEAVAHETGELVKRPVEVRVRTADQLAA
ncbi:MAG: DNA primase (bacterial type) [uncultured archaeon A07HB70]|nr:MAG: DNA primase (bacterial type) [uncultured archaeon A07HB70]